MKYLKIIMVVSLSLFSLFAFAKGKPGEFDYYLMALSWSPDYCASHKTDKKQCSKGKQLGFVLHGVWPQYTQGYPSSCSKDKINRNLCEPYPSEQLCKHEWEKHGTCSGLSAEEYVTLSKQLKENIVIPAAYTRPEQPFRAKTEDLKNEFVKSNPSLTANSIVTACSGSGRFLQEVRICFSKEGKPIECSAEVLNTSKKSCSKTDFLVRNVK